MRSIFLYLFLAIFVLSCSSNRSKNENKDVVSESVKTTVNENSYEMITKSGVHFIVLDDKQSASLSNVTVKLKGSEKKIELNDVDPVSQTFVLDVDNNGSDELFVVTTAAGSGAYATIYAFSYDNGKGITKIAAPEVDENSAVFDGYMGHDSVYVANGALYRKFPVYKKGDRNCCPTGGKRILKYRYNRGNPLWVTE